MLYYYQVQTSKIEMPAKSKLKSIKLIISKTMQECYIFEKGYGCIKEEVSRYNKLKEKIRKKIKSRFTDFKRKMFLKYRCKKGVAEVIENVNNNTMCKWKIVKFDMLGKVLVLVNVCDKYYKQNLKESTKLISSFSLINSINR